MQAQTINLTPRKILLHLLDIEKKIQRKDFRIYIPSKIQTPSVSNEILADEARKMMEFVGLYGYAIDVAYARTPEGTGGLCQNNGTEKIVHIQVSDAFQNNWDSSVAILAHEICHKLLFVHGLYQPIEMMNEVYAELSTIYFGFGEIVLNGYSAKNHTLGYLTPNTYKVINLLVCVVSGNVKSDVLNLQDIDPLADSAISLWESEVDKKALIRKCFLESEEQLAEYYRDINLSIQLLEQIKKETKGDFEKYDKTYYRDLNDTTHSSLRTFLCIYDNFCERELRSERVANLSEAIHESLFLTYTAYQEHGSVELGQDIECPICGLRKKNAFKGQKFTVVKCNSCHSHVAFYTAPWNLTVYQRMAKAKQQARKEAIDSEIRGYKTILKRETDASIEEVQKKANEQIAAARYKASSKVDEIKRNERQKAKEEFLERIPSLLRWLVAKYIKE